jgi:hypothetical protein
MVNILKIYLVKELDVPASLNTEDAISVRYPTVPLSDRGPYSHFTCIHAEMFIREDEQMLTRTANSAQLGT